MSNFLTVVVPVLIFLSTQVSLNHALPKPQTKYISDRYNSTGATPVFDNTVQIGAVVSHDSSDKFATLAQQVWGAWDIFVNWVNENGISVGNEKWGIKLTYLEDYSNSTYVTEGLTYLKTTQNIDFIWTPYSTGLTMAAVSVGSAAPSMLVMAGTSNGDGLWANPAYDITNAFSALTNNSANYYPSMAAFSAKGAKTAAYMCTSTGSSQTCYFDDEDSMTNILASKNIELKGYYEIPESGDANFITEVNSAVAQAKTDDVDLMIIHDYGDLCVQGGLSMESSGWTPKGFYLVVCGSKSSVLSAMGKTAYYVTAYTPWTSSGVYSSSITGYSNAQWASDFEAETGVIPQYQAASTFASLEILMKAIQEAGVADGKDTTAVTAKINARSAGDGFGTILSGTPLKFDPTHRGSLPFLVIQYQPIQGQTAGSYATVTSSSMTYPMPSWTSSERDTALSSTCTCNTTSSSTGNTYNTYDDCDQNELSTAIACTAIFCFLGGMGACAALLHFFRKCMVVTIGGNTAGETQMNPIK